MATYFFGRRGCLFSLLAYFLVVSAHAAVADYPFLPVEFSEPSVKVSDLPSPSSGISGLSPLIQPISQHFHLGLEYPGNHWNPIKDCFSYYVDTMIRFHCVQPTKRITVHGYAEWKVRIVGVTSPTGNVTVQGTFFSAEDETLIVDVADSLKTGVNYTLEIRLDFSAIDEKDRFGIQVFNRTREDTGDEIVTFSLSKAPKAMRRFVPCFDDPAYMIPYTWQVVTLFGLYLPAIATMQSPRGAVSHECPADLTKRLTRHYYTTPAMAIEATHLQVVPFSWYPNEPGVPEPPAECY